MKPCRAHGQKRAARVLVCAALLILGPGSARAEETAAAPPPLFASLDLSTYAGHPRVQSELRFFQGQGRETMARWLDRSGRFLPMIRERLAEAQLPQELCWLPMIESGFSNSAVSHKGAVGMWQFMPETARRYGLRVDRYVDERRNPLKSTSAAIEHLADLVEHFGSPYLAAAAYNAGERRVDRGLARLQGGAPADSGHDADFFRLADASLLARETRDYVPRLIAAGMIGRAPDDYGFHPAQGSAMAFDSLVVHRATRLDQIARAAGVSERAVRELNPEYLRGVTPPHARSIVLLPPGAPADLAARVSALPAVSAESETPSFTRAAYRRIERKSPTTRTAMNSAPRHVRVQRGESLDEVARRCGVSARELARLNLIPAGYRLHPSQILRLP